MQMEQLKRELETKKEELMQAQQSLGHSKEVGAAVPHIVDGRDWFIEQPRWASECQAVPSQHEEISLPLSPPAKQVLPAHGPAQGRWGMMWHPCRELSPFVLLSQSLYVLRQGWSSTKP